MHAAITRRREKTDDSSSSDGEACSEEEEDDDDEEDEDELANCELSWSVMIILPASKRMGAITKLLYSGEFGENVKDLL